MSGAMHLEKKKRHMAKSYYTMWNKLYTFTYLVQLQFQNPSFSI